jgi:hypothetical protein
VEIFLRGLAALFWTVCVTAQPWGLEVAFTASEQVRLRGRPNLSPRQLEQSFLCLRPDGE